MSKTMKRMMILALLTVVSVGLNAQEVIVAYNSSYEGGTVATKTISGQTVTITVTPSEGYYIEMKDIEVIAVKDPASATRGDEALPVGSLLTLTLLDGEGKSVIDKEGNPVSDPEDTTLPRDYEFTVPEGLGAWVCKADFHAVDKPVTSGTINKSVLWEVTGEGTSKTLTLSGEGTPVLDSKASDTYPWDTFNDDITELIVEDGIEAIGDGMLDGFKALSTIILKGTKYVSLGKNKLTKDVTVDVYGQLYNKYKVDAEWGLALIAARAGSVKMGGVAFGSGNDYDVFFSKEPVFIPSELTAYTVSAIDGSNVKISKIEDGIIPADVPVLLYSETIDDDDFMTSPTEENGSSTSSMLVVVKDEKGQEVALGEVYLLYNDVFYLSQAGTIPQGGIYLPKPVMKARTALTIGGDDEATAIIPHLSPFTSQLSDAWYSLDGRRLNGKPTAKGVYVNDGKKYIIK